MKHLPKLNRLFPMLAAAALTAMPAGASQVEEKDYAGYLVT